MFVLNCVMVWLLWMIVWLGSVLVVLLVVVLGVMLVNDY